jgi:hypothetical protein
MWEEKGIKRYQVNANHVSGVPDQRSRRLNPSTRPRAKVNHSVSGLKNSQLSVQFKKLIRRPRAIAFVFGFLVKSVSALVHGSTLKP